MPLPLTVARFSKIQTGFTFLVPAHPGGPGQRVVKRVCVCVYLATAWPPLVRCTWKTVPRCRSWPRGFGLSLELGSVSGLGDRSSISSNNNADKTYVPVDPNRSVSGTFFSGSFCSGRVGSWSCKNGLAVQVLRGRVLPDLLEDYVRSTRGRFLSWRHPARLWTRRAARVVHRSILCDPIQPNPSAD